MSILLDQSVILCHCRNTLILQYFNVIYLSSSISFSILFALNQFCNLISWLYVLWSVLLYLCAFFLSFLLLFFLEECLVSKQQVLSYFTSKFITHLTKKKLFLFSLVEVFLLNNLMYQPFYPHLFQYPHKNLKFWFKL